MPGDLPPVTTMHSADIIGDNWPDFSETGTVQQVLQQFREAAASVGTGDVSGTMFALIEANATGKTPEHLMQEFTADQRAAFDNAVIQLNQGQNLSVAAQDILNTKVQLNGVALSFEAAVEELLAEHAAGPKTPQTQQELQRRFNELLDQAKGEASKLGANHRSTQDSLAAAVQAGGPPQVPATMNPGDGMSQVPGMPPDALGALVQSIGGVMSKPPNLPMPKLDQAAQPMIQAAQQGLGELLKSAGKQGGVDMSPDVLSKLVSNVSDTNQKATLSSPAAARDAAPDRDGAAAGGTGGLRSPLTSATSGDNAQHSPVVTVEADEPLGEVTATTPIGPVDSASPGQSEPTVTLSSGGGGSTIGTLSEPGSATHLSSGGAASSAATLNPSAAAAPGSSPAAGTAGMGGGMPMMGPMMAGAGAGVGAPSAGGATDPVSKAGGRHADSAERRKYDPRDDHRTPAELMDFGADLKGLDHATDKQLIAASVLAGLVRAYRRAGLLTQAAVGVNDAGAVFVTSDGLGFLPPAVKVAAHVRPLAVSVPDAFITQWLGCDQPWKPLLDAVGQRYVGPFDAVVSTDTTAESHGVLALDGEQIDAVNISAGTDDRVLVDAIDPEDIDHVFMYLEGAWGRPDAGVDDLADRVTQRRWTDGDSRGYRQAWVHYLIAAAHDAREGGNIDDARYALRCALRVPSL